MWKTKYWSRLIASKMLSLFGLESLEEAAKRIIRRHDRIDDAFIVNRITSKIELIEKTPEFKKARFVHEQGTGWHGCDLFAFYLTQKKLYTTDVRDLLQEKKLKQIIKVLYQNKKLFVGKELLINRILPFKEASRERILDALGVTFYLDDKFSFMSVDVDIDLFYSDSVLQRMPQFDIKRYLEQGLRVANKSKCTHWHRIDCNDFMSIHDSRVPPLYYLTIPKIIWFHVTSKKTTFQNRLREPEFRSLFESSGFEVKTRLGHSSEKDRQYANYLLEKNNELKHLSPEKIAIKRFDMLAEKGGA